MNPDHPLEPGETLSDVAVPTHLDDVAPSDAIPTSTVSHDQSPAPEIDASAQRVQEAAANFALDDIVSGRFDAEQADETPAVPSKRVLLPEVETPKLHKILAQAGLGSRLEMEQMIVEGRITVNKEPAHIGMRIKFGDHITVNGKPIKVRIDPPPARILAYHKPAGEVVTHDDPQNRPTVFRRLPKLHQGKWQSVGRLDLNTEGLLLFTSSGELANRLTHPRFGLQREYAVRILGALSNEEKQKLLDGVMLDDGMAQFGSIEDGGGEGANCWYRVTISEGRNREVRRMIESLGHAVSRLIRIRYGTMLLPKGLKRGYWMELDEADVRALQQAAGSPPRNGSRNEGSGQAGSGKPQDKNRPNRRRAARGAKPSERGQSHRDTQDRPPQDRPPQDRQHFDRQPRQTERQDSPGDDFNNERLPSGINPERTSMDFVSKSGGRRGGSGGGFGANRGGGGNGGDGQPDPMRTSFGYIGADSLQRQRSGPKPSGGGNKGRSRGGRR